VSEKLVNGPDETTPLLGYNQNNSKMSGYTSSYSSFSSYPSRQKYKFSKKHEFTDDSSAYTFEAEKKSQDINLFDEYDKVVRTEIRLINKVCEDKELTELILNLNKYKKYFRNNVAAKYIHKEELNGYKNRPLYPKHSEINTEEDILDEFVRLEKEREEYKKN
jgi:hypothetical protein